MSAFVSLALLFIPGAGVILVPLLYLNTHIHELCHALAGLVSGGNVHRIEVFSNGSGVTLTSGGFLPLIAMAGYVGATIVGCALILASRTQKSARIGLVTLGSIMATGLAFWLRGDGVGVLSAIGWIAGIVLVLRSLPDKWLAFSCQFIGVQQCLMSVQSLLVLLHISRDSGAHNDALLASQAMFMPPIFWASVWTLVSFGAMGLALRSIWSGKPIFRGG